MEQALIGAGLGAVGSAVTGRDPIKGALLGGAGGGLFGGAGNLMNTGSFMGASPVGAQIAKNAMIGAPQAAGNFGILPGGAIGNMDYYTNVMGTPVFSGGQGIFTNTVDMLKDATPDIISRNLTPSNLLGVGNLLANLDNQPQVGASPISLSARPGQAPQQYAFNTGGLIRRA